MGHITVLLDKQLDPVTRDWYAVSAAEYGWLRNRAAEHDHEQDLERSGAAPSNFAQQPVAQDSELAQQIAKDPYSFEFLGLSGGVAE